VSVFWLCCLVFLFLFRSGEPLSVPAAAELGGSLVRISWFSTATVLAFAGWWHDMALRSTASPLDQDDPRSDTSAAFGPFVSGRQGDAGTGVVLARTQEENPSLAVSEQFRVQGRGFTAGPAVQNMSPGSDLAAACERGHSPPQITSLDKAIVQFADCMCGNLCLLCCNAPAHSGAGFQSERLFVMDRRTFVLPDGRTVELRKLGMWVNPDGEPNHQHEAWVLEGKAEERFMVREDRHPKIFSTSEMEETIRYSNLMWPVPVVDDFLWFLLCGTDSTLRGLPRRGDSAEKRGNRPKLLVKG